MIFTVVFNNNLVVWEPWHVIAEDGTLIYMCKTRKEAEQLAAWLSERYCA